MRSVYVVAENLLNAILQLQTYRFNFLPQEAFVRGRIVMDDRGRNMARTILERRLRRANSSTSLPAETEPDF